MSNGLEVLAITYLDTNTPLPSPTNCAWRVGTTETPRLRSLTSEQRHLVSELPTKDASLQSHAAAIQRTPDWQARQHQSAAYSVKRALVEPMMATIMAKMPKAEAKISITKILTKSAPFCASASAQPLPQMPTHTLLGKAGVPGQLLRRQRHQCCRSGGWREKEMEAIARPGYPERCEIVAVCVYKRVYICICVCGGGKGRSHRMNKGGRDWPGGRTRMQGCLYRNKLLPKRQNSPRTAEGF